MELREAWNYLVSLFDQEHLEQYPGEYGLFDGGNEKVTRVGYATNLSVETAELAAAEQIDLIITHHDVWDFIYGMREKCYDILRANRISHAFFHAPLDDADFGTNASLVEKLGAAIIARTNLYEGVFYAGRLAELDVPLDLTELVNRVEGILDEPVKFWRNNNRPVKRIGVVTGGGFMTNELKDLVDRGCDAYITGEKVLYTIQYAEFAGLNLIVGSHTYTEVFGVENLANKLTDHFNIHEAIRLPERHIE